MIKLENINKSFGSRALFTNFSAEFEEHKVTCILGASGVGKTTLINMVAGLIKPDNGRIIYPAGEKFRGSYVFQEHRLLPWLNVHENLDLVLRNFHRGEKDKKSMYSKEKRRALIRKQLKLVGLEEYEFASLNALSGGMIQRVALCRAFLYPADTLFLDEPFKEQDQKLKEELYDTFFKAYENDETKRTVLFVTHDIAEALRLADYIYVLSGNPAEIVGKFDRSEFEDNITERIKALL